MTNEQQPEALCAGRGPMGLPCRQPESARCHQPPPANPPPGPPNPAGTYHPFVPAPPSGETTGGKQ